MDLRHLVPAFVQSTGEMLGKAAGLTCVTHQKIEGHSVKACLTNNEMTTYKSFLLGWNSFFLLYGADPQYYMSLGGVFHARE